MFCLVQEIKNHNSNKIRCVDCKHHDIYKIDGFRQNRLGAAKIITLFYKSSKKSSICISVNEYEYIDKIISEGYTIEEKEKYYTNYKVFKLTKKTNMKITSIHMLFALLLCPIRHHICYDYSKMTLDIKFEAYYKTPYIEKLIRFVRKKKIFSKNTVKLNI